MQDLKVLALIADLYQLYYSEVLLRIAVLIHFGLRHCLVLLVLTFCLRVQTSFFMSVGTQTRQTIKIIISMYIDLSEINLRESLRPNLMT